MDIPPKLKDAKFFIILARQMQTIKPQISHYLYWHAFYNIIEPKGFTKDPSLFQWLTSFLDAAKLDIKDTTADPGEVLKLASSIYVQCRKTIEEGKVTAGTCKSLLEAHHLYECFIGVSKSNDQSIIAKSKECKMLSLNMSRELKTQGFVSIPPSSSSSKPNPSFSFDDNELEMEFNNASTALKGPPISTNSSFSPSSQFSSSPYNSSPNSTPTYSSPENSYGSFPNLSNSQSSPYQYQQNGGYQPPPQYPQNQPSPQYPQNQPSPQYPQNQPFPQYPQNQISQSTNLNLPPPFSFSPNQSTLATSKFPSSPYTTPTPPSYPNQQNSYPPSSPFSISSSIGSNTSSSSYQQNSYPNNNSHPAFNPVNSNDYGGQPFNMLPPPQHSPNPSTNQNSPTYQNPPFSSSQPLSSSSSSSLLSNPTESPVLSSQLQAISQRITLKSEAAKLLKAAFQSSEYSGWGKAEVALKNALVKLNQLNQLTKF